jgi:hypothetical protein
VVMAAVEWKAEGISCQIPIVAFGGTRVRQFSAPPV